MTSGLSKHNWSLFGNIFTKSRNRLVLERAQKLGFFRNNSSRAVGPDEEMMLSKSELETVRMDSEHQEPVH